MAKSKSTKLRVPKMPVIEPLKKPAKKKIKTVNRRPTPAEFKKLCDRTGRLKAVIAVGLTELGRSDLMNETVDERIVPAGIVSTVEGISFKAVGIVAGGSRILIEFRADATGVLTEIDHPEPDEPIEPPAPVPELPPDTIP